MDTVAVATVPDLGLAVLAAGAVARAAEVALAGAAEQTAAEACGTLEKPLEAEADREAG